MFEQAYHPKKLFTLDEANAMLPLVRAITSDLVKLSREVVDRRQRFSHVMAERPEPKYSSGDPYDDELAQVEQELERDAQRLREYVDELRELGVEPKGAIEGLIDFPAMVDDRIVYLCWKIGEPEVLHWHELEAGYAGRQALTAEMVASGDGGAED